MSKVGRTVTIAVDACGGDHAVDEIVRGVASVSIEAPHVQTLLVGPEQKLSLMLEAVRHNPERIAIHHVEGPLRPSRGAPSGALTAAAELVASGDAQALVSAAEADACLQVCASRWRRIAGLERPVLAAVYPTELRRGEKDDPFSLLLDVGASMEAGARDLVTFAVMGSAYAARVARNPRPRVALLSVADRGAGGPREIVEAHRLLREQTSLNFIGNIEAADIPTGSADVVVCPGFAGGLVLEMLEAIPQAVVALARYAYKEKLVWRLGLAMLSEGIRRLKATSEWEQYGGAPLLGYEHLLIHTHRSSRARAIANAVKVAAKVASQALPSEIEEALRRLEACAA